MKSKNVFTLKAGLLLLSLSAANAQADVPSVQAVGEIRSNLGDNLCLDSADRRHPDGGQVHLWQCHGGDNQQWYFLMNGDIRLKSDPTKCLEQGGFIWTCHGAAHQKWELVGETLRSKASGACLDVAHGRTANGTNIGGYSCNGSGAQSWSLTQVPWAEIKLANVGVCLDVEHASGENGKNIGLWGCHGGDGQKWYLTAENEIRSAVAANKCLDISGGHFYSGNNVQIWDCNGTDAQKWQFNKEGILTSKVKPNLCLDVDGGYSHWGDNVQLWQCNGTAAQQWESSTFVTMALTQVDDAIAVKLDAGGTEYVVVDPIAIVHLLHKHGVTNENLNKVIASMNTAQKDIIGYSNNVLNSAATLLERSDINARIVPLDDAISGGFSVSDLLNANAHIGLDKISGRLAISDASLGIFLGKSGASVSFNTDGGSAAGLNLAISSEFDAKIRTDGGYGFSLTFAGSSVGIFVSMDDLESMKDALLEAGEWLDKAQKEAEGWFNNAAKDSSNWSKNAYNDTKEFVEDTGHWIDQAADDFIDFFSFW